MAYIVKQGDTLSKLYGSNWKKLSGYTGDPAKLQVGTQLNDLPSSNVITADSLKPTQPFTLPEAPKVDTAGLLGTTQGATNYVADLTKQLETAQTASENSQSDIIKTMNDLLNKQSDIQTASESTGLNASAKRLRELSAQASSLSREAQAIPLQTQENFKNTGATDTGVAPIQAGALRTNALKALSIAQQADIETANYNAAKDKTEQIINLKYQPIEQQLEIKKQQYEFNKDILKSIDAKRTEALSIALKKEEQDIADAKDREKNIQNLTLTLAKNQAPQNVIASLSKLDTNSPNYFNEAVRIASPYLQSLEDKVDLDYKMAQTAKIYNDMKNNGASNLEPSQSLAYAQEYASTGKIPTGLPKGSFGKVAQWAKELPKQKGELVNTNTGVVPTNIGNEAQQGLIGLYNAIEKAKELKELDKNRKSGLIAGSVGKLFGSKAQNEYITARDLTLKELQYALSGKALIKQEMDYFDSLLPGRFSEPTIFKFGVNSQDSINSFIKNASDTLRNKLNSSGASIYGFSKVNIGGDEYTVGDIIKNESGQMGRINPDGSITLIQ